MTNCAGKFTKLAVIAGILAVVSVPRSHAAEIKVLTAGAMKSVVLAVADDFRKSTGHTLVVENETVGALVKRIEGGAAFDVAIVSPGAIDELAGKGKIAAGSKTVVSRVGVGVMVKAGAAKPDISNVDAFKRTLLAAKTVGYIDPASGGSSGIYLTGLFEKLGIADAIKPKAKLKQGGYVADLVSSGEAEIGIHQISEILPAPGVMLVGPLPAEIQNYTVYAAGVGTGAKDAAAASALIAWLAGPQTAPVLQTKGMERPPV
jgi:molybdate transport system substrate-binding protein